MHPHRKESIPHYYYILTSYGSSTLTTTITMDAEEDANAKMFYMASMSTWLQCLHGFKSHIFSSGGNISLKKCKIGTANKQFIALDLEFWKYLKGLMNNISG